MKKKILVLLLILFVAVMAGCNKPVVNPSPVPEADKDLTALISCLGYPQQAYKDLGDLPEPEVRGNILRYSLPEDKGYYSGFTFWVNLDGEFAKSFYLEPKKIGIKINDCGFPSSVQHVKNSFDKEVEGQWKSPFGVEGEYFQFIDLDYHYVFYHRDNQVYAFEISPLSAYKKQLRIEQEELNNEQIDYTKYDTIVIGNYDGLLNDAFNNYQFDVGIGEDKYKVTIIGRVNDAKLLFGYRYSEAFFLVEMDVAGNQHLTFTGLPPIESDQVLALRFNTVLGETQEIELSQEKNKIYYKEKYSDKMREVKGNQEIVNDILAYNKDGEEHRFIISQDRDGDQRYNYMYRKTDRGLELLVKEPSIGHSGVEQGLIANPNLLDNGKISYTLALASDIEPFGLTYRTKIYNEVTKTSVSFSEGSLVTVLDDENEDYYCHMIVRSFDNSGRLLKQNYRLLTPEGEFLVDLGCSLSPIGWGLEEQIKEAMAER